MATQVPERIATRLTLQDMRIIAAAKDRLGLISVSDVIRVALRALARELRLNLDGAQ